jgi:IrrE N-terminal-like domain
MSVLDREQLTTGVPHRERVHFDREVAQLSLFEDSRRRRPWLKGDDDHVIAVATDVVKELDLTPPVDAEMVLSFLGVRKIVREPIPWSGLLFDDDGDLTVKVRLTDSRPRQRFSMLHEGGHTFLPGFNRVPQFRCNPGQITGTSNPSVELLSDIAASELLFPRHHFIKELTGRPTLDLVEELAERYQASIKATAIRVVSLSPVDARLVVLTMSHKPSQRAEGGHVPALRVQWSVGRGDWPYIPRHKSVTPGSPLLRAFLGEEIEESSSPSEICQLEERMHLSARRYTYAIAVGETRTEVLAIYSRGWSKIQVCDG